MPSIRSTYHRQDRDSGLNERENIQSRSQSELPSNPSYYEARNFRPASLDKLTREAMNNMKGTLERIDVNGAFYYYNGSAWVQHSGGIYSDHIIIGVGQIRDTTYYFTTNNTAANPDNGRGVIWRVNLHATVPQDTLYRLYTGFIGFSTQWPIFLNVVGRYETNEIQKLYWTNGYHIMKFANVADSNLVALSSQSVTDFNMVNEVTLSKPYLSAISGGNIYTGVIQYAYRLYKLNGPETVFSPASELIPITNESESLTYTSKYKGQSEKDSVGDPNKAYKSCVITINDIDTSYDRVEVVAIHYTNINEDPSISIVGRYNATSTLIVTDSGSYNIGTYTLNEFRTLGGLIFIPKKLSSKDNKLFAANLKVQNFDVDFDARAYRFRAGDRHGLILNSDGSSYTINGANPTLTPGGYTSWLTIPETADAINPYNDFTNDHNANQRYVYQANGTTFGGEGPYIKYTFDVENIEIDDGSGLENMRVGQAGTTANPSYKNYASPFVKTLKLGYRRDETYRIAIVFTNDYGQESFPKWMGDIRFPRGKESSSKYKVAFVSGGKTYANILKLQVQIKIALPTGATGWKIVRVKREEKDKTILASGLLGAWNPKSSGYDTNFHDSAANTVTNLVPNVRDSGGCVYLMSPEVNFYKTLNVGAEDYLDPIGHCPSTYVEKGFLEKSGSYYSRILKLREFYPHTYNTNFYMRSVQEGKVFEAITNDETTVDLPETETFDFTSRNFKMLNSQLYRIGATEKYYNTSAKGTMFALQMNVINWYLDPGVGVTDYLYGNYKRKVVQYEGNTYSARQNNIYIPCSEIFTSITSKDIFGGDTYVTMYDYLYGQSYWGDAEATTPSMIGYNSIIYFPVETSINLELRHDDCFHRIKDLGHPNATSLRESKNGTVRVAYFYNNAGTWEWRGASDYEDMEYTDMYLYNSVYSKENDSKISVAEPLDFIEQEIKDCYVQASREKINGEERDSWLRWDSDENIEVDSQFGPIEDLITFNNHLIFFQHDGIGTLSVNEKALLEGATQATLELGTGGVLERYDMLATQTGVQGQLQVVQSPYGFYWVDPKRKEFQRYSGKLMNISKVKGSDSWFQDIPAGYESSLTSANTTGMIVGYDPTFKEILINRKDSYSTGEALIFNEMKDEFTSIFDYDYAAMFFNTSYKMFAVGTLAYNNSNIYEFNVGPYNTFFGYNRNPELVYIINPMKEAVCVYNVFEFACEQYDGSNNNLVDAIPQSIRMENDYQDSGVILVSLNNNLKRRIRTWRFVDFRNAGDNSRMRDTYLKLTIKFQGTDQYKIVMHPLTTHYMVPAESLAP